MPTNEVGKCTNLNSADESCEEMMIYRLRKSVNGRNEQLETKDQKCMIYRPMRSVNGVFCK